MVDKPKKAAKKSTGLGAYSDRGFEPKEINNEESTRRYVRLLTGSLKREACFRTCVDPEGVDGIPHKPKGTLADCLAELRGPHGLCVTRDPSNRRSISVISSPRRILAPGGGARRRRHARLLELLEHELAH
jgi:hypothetical protein